MMYNARAHTRIVPRQKRMQPTNSPSMPHFSTRRASASCFLRREQRRAQTPTRVKFLIIHLMLPSKQTLHVVLEPLEITINKKWLRCMWTMWTGWNRDVTIQWRSPPHFKELCSLAQVDGWSTLTSNLASLTNKLHNCYDSSCLLPVYQITLKDT